MSSFYSEGNSFKEWEYRAYFAYYFVLFLHETKVIFVHLAHVMELCVEFLIDGMKECKTIIVWPKQYFLTLALGN
jgi:hypothetical protein